MVRFQAVLVSYFHDLDEFVAVLDPPGVLRVGKISLYFEFFSEKIVIYDLFHRFFSQMIVILDLWVFLFEILVNLFDLLVSFRVKNQTDNVG